MNREIALAANSFRVEIDAHGIVLGEAPAFARRLAVIKEKRSPVFGGAAQ